MKTWPLSLPLLFAAGYFTALKTQLAPTELEAGGLGIQEGGKW